MTKVLMMTVTLAVVTALSGCARLPNQVDRLQYADLGDNDRDGVINQRDICTETSASTDVDNVGCSEWQRSAQVTNINIAFDYDRYNLRSDQRPELQRIIERLKRNNTTHVMLLGDTSSEGSLAYNDRLARKRAATITSALVSAGISRSRIEEHYFSENVAIIRATLKSRQRRTVALIYSDKLSPRDAWTIYSTEQAKRGQ